MTGLSAAAWDRAQRFFPWVLRPHLRTLQVRPHWVDAERFWYRREEEGGRISFPLVTAATGNSVPAFDHAALSALLPAGQGLEAITLLEADGRRARFRLDDTVWVFDGGVLTRDAAPIARPGEVLSPDLSRAAFRRGDDLWLRDTTTGAERPLTTDGAPGFAWAKSPDMNLTTISLARRGIALPAVVLWSPDGRHLLTHLLDERAVGETPLVQHVPQDGSVRPVLHSMRVALSGDAALPMVHLAVIDTETGAVVAADAPPVIAGVTTPIERQEAWWGADGRVVFFLDRDRLSRRVTLHAMDAGSGVVRTVITETSDTHVDLNLSVSGLPNIRVLEASGEVVWFSQRDGWAHLYLHDLATGMQTRRLTAGDWVVRDLLAVDATRRQVWLLAAGIDPGENPYHRVLCRVGLDGGAVEVLTPGAGDHLLAMPEARMPRDHIRPPTDPGWFLSPDFRFFVQTTASLETRPRSTLHRADGGDIALLEEGSIGPAYRDTWRWPAPLHLTAADGETTLFGAMWLPTSFDPTRRYPIIDYIYPGPQRGKVPTVALPDSAGELFISMLPQAFAELGFAVIELDGRGTPLRSKAFHDASYGRLDDPGMLADHVAALRQLAAAHSFLDTTRVGMMGHSGGGYATVRAMLEHPDVFHAGVATAGNHDQRGYTFSWCEKYQGPLAPLAGGGTTFDGAANPPLASRLRGKLFLATGDMDDNVHPALTLQLVAALIAADRDFEMLVMPNEDHATLWQRPYFLRRAMDFLVRALIDGD